MRIITWNCCSGDVSGCLAHLAPLQADLVALQEVAQPGLPLVVAGDFNVDLGSAPQTPKHRRLANLLHDECGLVSAYHAHRQQAYGHDAEVPTYRHLRKAERTWHIDYCFVPAAWKSRLRSAQVVEGDEWLKRSDHSPVVVELAD